MIPAYLGKPNTSKRASDLVSESSSVGQERADNEGDDNKLAAKETALVNRSKIAVCLVVLMAAAATGTFTYIFMENEEKVWYLDEVSKDRLEPIVIPEGVLSLTSTKYFCKTV